MGTFPSDLTRRHEASDEEKAHVFLQYWNLTKNTTYARMFKTAMEDLYEMRDWSVESILQANDKVLAADCKRKRTFRPWCRLQGGV